MSQQPSCTSVPGVTPSMLDAQFWLSCVDDAMTVYDVDTICHVIEPGAHLADLDAMSRNFTEPEKWVAEGIPAPDEGYLRDGRPLDSAMRERIEANAAVRAVPERFGFSIRRAPIGAWPTPLAIFRTPGDREFDQVQQTALHTFEPVLILGESQDQAWYLVQSRTYQGWIMKSHVAWCENALWDRYATPAAPLVVVGRGVSTEPDPYSESSDAIAVEFGAWLPKSQEPWPGESRQDAIWHHIVDIPLRTPEGQLSVVSRLIARTAPVVNGFLPATRHSVLNSAFALLGDRYGWGDSFNRHDCSSFIMDVYRTIGVQLPRNSKSQSLAVPDRVPLGQNWEASLLQARPGDELYMPGHVLLYLGIFEAQHYAIHAFVGYSEGPGTEPVLANQVMVTPLAIHLRNGEKRYGDALTSVHAILP